MIKPFRIPILILTLVLGTGGHVSTADALEEAAAVKPIEEPEVIAKPSPVRKDKEDDKVYVDRRGLRFHKQAVCPLAAGQDTKAVTLRKATVSGMKPCEECFKGLERQDVQVKIEKVNSDLKAERIPSVEDLRPIWTVKKEDYRLKTEDVHPVIR